MFASFLSALSGLNAAGTSIDSIGNDLANLNTTGYKASSLSFEDVVADVTATSSHQIGSGVSSPIIFKNFSQGSLQVTGGVNDAAIQGDGFFIVRQAAPGSGVQTNADVTLDEFTRAGNFQVDPNGILTTATGQRVQGWSLDTSTNAVNTSKPIGDIIVPVGTNRGAKATTTFSADLNLDASAAAGATFAVPVNIYDSLGNSHVITATFTKGAAPDQWDASVTTTDPAITISGGGPFTFTFDNNGALTPPAPAGLNAIKLTLTNGAAPTQTLTWSPWVTAPSAGPPAVAGVGRLTQFAEPSATSVINQDGLAAAQLTGVSINDGGFVVAQYSNGSQQQVAELALASVRNPSSLVKIGDNNYRAGEDTATPVVGESGSGGRGSIVGGSLESSNVDMATEFTQLIIFQRSYSANARVITTTDQISQETINLIH